MIFTICLHCFVDREFLSFENYVSSFDQGNSSSNVITQTCFSENSFDFSFNSYITTYQSVLPSFSSNFSKSLTCCAHTSNKNTKRYWTNINFVIKLSNFNNSSSTIIKETHPKVAHQNMKLLLTDEDASINNTSFNDTKPTFISQKNKRQMPVLTMVLQ